MQQLSIDLPRLEATGRSDFMVSPANETALAFIDRSPDWPDRRLALVGPEGSGKSHLAAIWVEAAGGDRVHAGDLQAEAAPGLADTPLAVEDVDRILGDAVREHALFHLWNAFARRGQLLLLTGRGVPATWHAGLPDLRSRLSSLTPVKLEQPDEALLSAVLVKQLSDRQMALKPQLVQYMIPRMERSFAAVRHMVEALDTRSLTEAQPVDLKLIKRILGT